MTDNSDVDAALAPSVHNQSPFPPIHLSVDDKQTILDQVDQLLGAALAEYESHLLDDRGAVSELQWKPVQRRDGFASYRKRCTSPRASNSSKVHTVLVVGSLPGSVDDVMLGSANPSADFAVAYAEYVIKESILGSVVLYPISLPTRDQPDKSVALKWDAHGSMSSTLNRVFMPRDFVAVEATGSTINSMGERIGYRFFHSVDVSGAPPLSIMLRGTKHFTYLYRQMSSDQIHVYVAGRIDPKDNIPTGVMARATTNGIIETVLRTKRFAEIKKRTVCGKTTSRVALLSSAKACSVCGKSACGSCFESKKAIVTRSPGTGKRIDFKKTAFCSLCLADAQNLSGWDLALAEVAALTSSCKGDDGGGSSSSSTTVSSLHLS